MDNHYKLLSEVVKFSYEIGSYQGGSRWDTVNVQKLLEDIYEGKLNKDYKDKLIQDLLSSGSECEDKNTSVVASKKIIIKKLKKKVKDKNKYPEYCLHPLAVKKNGNHYSVIDKQQSLTTLYIILKALCSISDIKFPRKFSIEYLSRNDLSKFLQNLSDDSKSTDIDGAYILQVYKCAKDWFAALLAEDSHTDNMCELANAYASYLCYILLWRTKFIWNENEESPEDESSEDMNKNEQKIFADRNTEKLELTDSELIKSLFVNPEYYGKSSVNITDHRIRISKIWDTYKNELDNDELWAFLPISDELKGKYSSSTRMNAIFLLLKKKKKEEKRKKKKKKQEKENKAESNPHEENSLFKAVKYWIDDGIGVSKSDPTYDECALNAMISSWREVCDLFDGIKELYEDNEIYNLLSLLKMSMWKIPDELFKQYLKVLETPKNERTACIKKVICGELFREGVSATVKKKRFPKKKGPRWPIKKILLAHSVAIMNSSGPIRRFEFRLFDKKARNWHVEHICSTNEEYIADADMKEKVELLRIFSAQEDNIYMEYIKALYGGKKIKEVQSKMEDKEFRDNYFEGLKERYNEDFDIWRCFELRESTRELLFDYNVSGRIEEIVSFFEKGKSIDEGDYTRGNAADYKKFAPFINDNSMGNLMLLPPEINSNAGYANKNFEIKRQYVADQGNVFLPVATLNVLRGKYIEPGTSAKQWLMKERKAYLEDMVLTMSSYYEEKDEHA